MQFELTKIKSACVAAYRTLFGGRIARTTFAIRAAILIAVVAILNAPLNTILAPSSKTLRDAYLALALCVFGLCLIGIVSAYVKRLHDMGLRGYWALAFLNLLPMAIIGLGGLYIDYRYKSDHSYNTAELVGLIGNVAFIVPFLIAMWRGEKAENRFGPAPMPVEHVSASKFNIAAAAGAAAILIPTCIYAGLFQSGVWVGRGAGAPSMPFMDSNVSGTRFMKCWNVKGVGAGSGEGPVSGVYRDGYEGTLFDFIVTPGGQIDIATAGNPIGKSYLEDGFRIVPYGLRLPQVGSGYINVRGLDRFMLVAIFDQGGPGAAINYTTFTFGRNKDTWPEYHVVMTSALSSSANATDLAKFPEARGRLMIGDCMSG
jgi:uncharacterized membrane protein YhaH (DUF805 family)